MDCTFPSPPFPPARQSSHSCIHSIRNAGNLECAFSIQDQVLPLSICRPQQGFGVLVNDVACFLHHCRSAELLAQGNQLHNKIIESGYEHNVCINNTLIDMYSRCGSLRQACMVFAKISEWNIFSWTAIISAHMEHNNTINAIFLFKEMVNTGMEPDKVLFVVILKACTSEVAVEEAWWVHARILECGVECDSYVGSALITMHMEDGNLVLAQICFDKILEPNVVVWNSLIMGCVKQGFSKEALQLYIRMQRSCVPDIVTILGGLKACIQLEDLEKGMVVHADAVDSGLASDIFVESSLVDMYVKCGSIHTADMCFNKIEKRNVVVWTTIISGYVQLGACERALLLFEEMRCGDSVLPNELTYASIVTACSRILLVRRAQEIHSDIVQHGYERDEHITNALIDMYAKCGHVEDAHDIFNKIQNKDVIVWNTMLLGCSQQGLWEETLELFGRLQEQGLKPDGVTFISVIQGCTQMDDLERGKRYHAQVIGRGILLDAFIASSLLLMYVKSNKMRDAREVFDNVQQQDLALWNMLISGYASHGPFEAALEMFEKMEKDGFTPDNVTYIAVLGVCATISFLKQGQQVHTHMMKIGICSDPHIESTLLDMYAKCGSLEDAEYIFEHMHECDEVSWTAMITAYAHLGHGKVAILLFERMKSKGFRPNEIAFIAILNACRHGGLVHEGLLYFKSMRDVEGITPTMSHYACLIDLLGRCGYLEAALDLIYQMPINPSEVIWIAFLGACRSCNNIVLARHAMEKLQNLGFEDPYVDVLLSNILTS